MISSSALHAWVRAVVTERYKFIHYLNHKIDPPKPSEVSRSPEYLLFDLSRDPRESVNLAEDPEYVAIREDMQHRLQVWTQRVGDRGMETEYEAIAMFPEEIGHLKGTLK